MFVLWLWRGVSADEASSSTISIKCLGTVCAQFEQYLLQCPVACSCSCVGHSCGGRAAGAVPAEASGSATNAGAQASCALNIAALALGVQAPCPPAALTGARPGRDGHLLLLLCVSILCLILFGQVCFLLPFVLCSIGLVQGSCRPDPASPFCVFTLQPGSVVLALCS